MEKEKERGEEEKARDEGRVRTREGGRTREGREDEGRVRRREEGRTREGREDEGRGGGGKRGG